MERERPFPGGCGCEGREDRQDRSGNCRRGGDGDRCHRTGGGSWLYRYPIPIRTVRSSARRPQATTIWRMGRPLELAGQVRFYGGSVYGEFDPSHGISREEYERICESYTSYFAYVDSIPTAQTWRFLQARAPSAARSWALATELQMRNSWNRCAV